MTRFNIMSNLTLVCSSTTIYRMKKTVFFSRYRLIFWKVRVLRVLFHWKNFWREFVFTSLNSVYTVGEVKTSRWLLEKSLRLLLLHLEDLQFLILKWRRKVPFLRTTKTQKVITVFTCCLHLFGPNKESFMFLFVGFDCNYCSLSCFTILFFIDTLFV